jgi:uncharacterized protein
MGRLMVFAKAPQAGRVKTRLAPAVGAENAARLHEAFVRDVVARHARPDRPMTVWRAGDLTHPLWAELGASLETQPPGELGHRMRFAFEQEGAAGEAVVVLGTDSPSLPPALVDAAFEALTRVPVVLGPACDGGYYLLGLRGCVPPIFDDVPWGTGSVLTDTLAALRAAGQRYELLPFWYDVDRPADLTLLKAHLPTLEVPPRHAAALLAELGELAELAELGEDA